ncbi:hypothetical protein N801_10045 [Knoellia aerolata DSM 18566]|uniref:Uncharacterized protein n=1 Tax=Knoellia aerolata DSM 18566 TaxID=1385519 RepID=A0A0A0JUJ9_9MICO|nr:hypothetical protein N801_10045 [Knoellia aerolata DSM 18566]
MDQLTEAREALAAHARSVLGLPTAAASQMEAGLH